MKKVFFGLYLISIWILFGSYLVWFVIIWELLWFDFVFFGSYFVVFDLIWSYLVLFKSYLVLFGSYLVWFGPYLDLIRPYLDLSLSHLAFIWLLLSSYLVLFRSKKGLPWLIWSYSYLNWPKRLPWLCI